MTALEMIEIAGLLLFGTGGGILGSVLYFKPKLDKEKAEADIAKVEAEDRRHDYLEERIAKMEELYNIQGRNLDEVRKDYLTLQSELTKVKQENIALRTELDAVKEENKQLNARLESYKNQSK